LIFSTRKLVIGVLICSGFFVIAAAIIRVVLTLGASPSGTNINRWGVRETIVGIISVNIPILRPMFTKAFWTKTQPIHSSYLGGKSTLGGRSRALENGEGPYEMASSVTDGRSVKDNGSEEYIVGPSDKSGVRPTDNEIHVQTVYQVKTEDALKGGGTEGWETNGTTSRVQAGTRNDQY
jgi:hypothetical protein